MLAMEGVGCVVEFFSPSLALICFRRIFSLVLCLFWVSRSQYNRLGSALTLPLTFLPRRSLLCIILSLFCFPAAFSPLVIRHVPFPTLSTQHSLIFLVFVFLCFLPSYQLATLFESLPILSFGCFVHSRFVFVSRSSSVVIWAPCSQL